LEKNKAWLANVRASKGVSGQRQGEEEWTKHERARHGIIAANAKNVFPFKIRKAFSFRNFTREVERGGRG